MPWANVSHLRSDEDTFNMSKCEHGLTSKECYVCASPKYGKHADDLAVSAAPQPSAEAVREAAYAQIVGRYRVEKRGRGYWSHCVKAGDGMMEIFVGHKKSCENVAAALQTACLDGAFIATTDAIDAARKGER